MFTPDRLRLLLVAAAVLATALTATAQFQRDAPPVEPRVLSGPDVGFRLEGTDPRTGQPTGTWVVRLNGKWVEVSGVPGIRPATK